jgi:hypothetical protein
MAHPNAIALLKDARKRIAKNWITGMLYNGGDGVCSVGALNRAARAQGNGYSESKRAKYPGYREAMNAVAHQITPWKKDEPPQRMREVVVINFNDNVAAGSADVLRRFDAAIKCLEKENADAR